MSLATRDEGDRRRCRPSGLFPEHNEHILARVMISITRNKNPNPRRCRSYRHGVKRARHNSYPVKKFGNIGIWHDGPGHDLARKFCPDQRDQLRLRVC